MCATPVANAGPDINIKDNGSGEEWAALWGNNSYDPDGLIKSWEWREDSKVLSRKNFCKGYFSLGTHVVTLKVTNNSGETDTDSVTIRVNLLFPCFSRLRPVKLTPFCVINNVGFPG